MLPDIGIPIIGEQVYLRPLETHDATERYCHWLNDPEVNKYLETRQATIAELQAYITEKRAKDDCLFLGIFLKETDQHIGNVKLEPIDLQKKIATVGILIGEKEHWGKGIATEVTNLISDYAFQNLQLHEVNLGVLAANKPAIRVYEKCGFYTYQVDPASMNHDGVIYDQVWMKKLAPTPNSI